MPIPFFNEVINSLKTLGCEYLNITGGEPLLHKDIWEFVRLASAHGIKPLLSTNGLLLPSICDPRLNSLALISLPLDAAIPELNDKIRCKGHFMHIVDLIDEYLQSNPKFILKVNTIVFHDNILQLHNILPLINYDRIIWKLFQYSPKGDFSLQQSVKGVQNEEFNEIARQISGTPGIRCKIEKLGADDPAGYLIIDPEGNIYLPKGNAYDIMGNIRDQKVVEMLEKSHSKVD